LQHGALSIESVVERIQGQRVLRIEELEEKREELEVELEDAEEALGEVTLELESVGEEDKAGKKRVGKRVTTAKKRVTELKGKWNLLMAELTPIKSQYTFFANFTAEYLEKEEISCPVCLEDDMKDQDLAILPCGHCVCPGCAERLCGGDGEGRPQYPNLAMHPGSCPNCRNGFRVGDVMKLEAQSKHEDKVLHPAEKGDADKDDAAPAKSDVDLTKFGSKLRNVVGYINRVLAADSKHRVVLFIQWGDLAELVSEALDGFGVGNVRLYRGWNNREKALQRFRAGLRPEPEPEPVVDLDFYPPSSSSYSRYKHYNAHHNRADPAPATARTKSPPPVKVLILSATDSVSGLNLTEASHVVILHPFWDEVEEHARGAEMQGVARCVRLGQERSVRVARFMCKGTVEEEIWRGRWGGDVEGEANGEGVVV
ncbi:hypothetical protein HK097_003366, partial [Rhizophlyctis rosea]